LWFSSACSGNSGILLCNRAQLLFSSSFKINCSHSTSHLTLYGNALLKGLLNNQQIFEHAILYTSLEICVCRYLMWKVMLEICEIKATLLTWIMLSNCHVMDSYHGGCS
jgi:hypothetical protein